MKLFKRIAIIGILVVLVVVIGAYFAIDQIARSIVGSQGTSVLGVPTSVSSVRLAVFSAESGFSDLTIANPEGFQKPNFIEIEKAEFSASIGTLLSSNIDIPLVHIKGLTVDLEQIAGKPTNVSEIIKNINANTKKPDDVDDPMKFNIKKLIIEDIRLTASGSIVNIAGGKVDTKIPRIELNNLGTETDGDQLSQQLISMMLGVLMKHIAENPIQGLSGAAVGSMVTAIESIPILGSSQAGRTLGQLLMGANHEINSGVQGIGAKLDGIGNGIKDLFSGDPKSDDDKKSDDDPKKGD